MRKERYRECNFRSKAVVWISQETKMWGRMRRDTMEIRGRTGPPFRLPRLRYTGTPLRLTGQGNGHRGPRPTIMTP